MNSEIENKQFVINKIKDFAYSLHEQPTGSQRYGTAPYRKHLDDVVSVVKRYLFYLDERYHDTMIAAAYCHDLIEDTEITAKTLAEHSNKEVSDLVFLVTNEMGRNRKERNFKTYPKIWENDLAIFLKLCDRISNTTNSRNKKHEMYEVYREEYPVFRYALKVRGLYTKMWEELDKLNEFVPIVKIQ